MDMFDVVIWLSGYRELIGPGLAMHFGDNVVARQMGASHVKAKY